MSCLGVGHWWQYPLRRPSPRFNTVNAIAQALDLQFSVLSPLTQFGWGVTATLYPWSAVCIEEIIDPPIDYLVTRRPVDAYRTVNLSRWVAGLTTLSFAPAILTAPNGDSFVPVGSGLQAVKWVGRPSPPSGDYYCQVYGCGLMHEPESGPATQRFRFAFCSPILYNTNFFYSDLYDKLPGLLGVPCTMAILAIQDAAGSPFFATRLVLRSPG